MEKKNLCVCDYCKSAIFSREGRQPFVVLYVDPDDDKESVCDWCGESGNDTLYEIFTSDNEGRF